MEKINACLELEAENLKSNDILNKSDPYFEVFHPSDMKTPIYRSEVVKNNSDPLWKPAKFNMPSSTKYVRIRIMDKDRFLKDELILECEIEYPFRRDNYIFGAWASYDKTEARVYVLNDDGEDNKDFKSG